MTTVRVYHPGLPAEGIEADEATLALFEELGFIERRGEFFWLTDKAAAYVDEMAQREPDYSRYDPALE